MPTALNTWLARHAQTLMGSLGRIVQHPVATAMTMAVIALALALPLFFNVLLRTHAPPRPTGIRHSSSRCISPRRPEPSAPRPRQAAPSSARRRAGARDHRRAGAREFRESSGFGKALDLLDTNPLPNALVVTPSLAASTAEGTQALKVHIATLADVDTVELDTEWVQRLNALLDVVRRVIWLTGALLALSVVLVVGNTIRLDILNRRAEIEVMKLVGATDSFARRPFSIAASGMGSAAVSARCSWLRSPPPSSRSRSSGSSGSMAASSSSGA
jgi:cell division transport system permease protein